MTKEQDLQTHVLNIMNEVLLYEPEALRDIIEHRAPVLGDKLLSRYSPVVVQVDNVKTSTNPKLGVLGLINGILGNDHRIMAIFEDDGRITSFKPFVHRATV